MVTCANIVHLKYAFWNQRFKLRCFLGAGCNAFQVINQFAEFFSTFRNSFYIFLTGLLVQRQFTDVGLEVLSEFVEFAGQSLYCTPNYLDKFPNCWNNKIMGRLKDTPPPVSHQ